MPTPLKIKKLPPALKKQIDKFLKAEGEKVVIFSSSGGKDSEAMSYYLADLLTPHRDKVRFITIHADVGDWEWEYAETMAERIAHKIGSEFVVVRSDLYSGISEYMDKREAMHPEAPAMPSKKARYCTSDLKRNPIDKWVRNTFPENTTILMAMGLRADESPARAKLLPCAPRIKASAPTKNRNVFDILPIQHWTLEEVWGYLGYTLAELEALQKIGRARWLAGEDMLDIADSLGFKSAPPYVIGNDRFSCKTCMLACKADIENGVRADPLLAARLAAYEERSGFTFTQEISIKDIIIWQSAENA